MNKTKLIIVATHPIQYHAPWFRALSMQANLELIVIFGMLPDAQQQSTGFGKKFSWDIPLTDGYQWQSLENTSSNPNLSSFTGIDCPSIFQAVKDLEPDAILITGWHSKFLLQTLWAAQRLKIKTIMRGESNAKKPRPWYIHLMHTLFLSRFDAFLTIGSSNAQFYVNNKVATGSLFSAPYFIENKRFLQGLTSKGSEQSFKTNLPSNDFCFVYAGKLIEKKNVLELLTAFKLVYSEHKNCQMMIIGDGELRPELEAYVQQHRLPVIFCGFVNQSLLPSTYAQGDCFVLGSDYDETWGLVVNEAMVCGLPAIVSNRAGSSEDLIIEGQTGFVYQYGSPLQLSQKMIFMLENRDKAISMGKNAQQHVLNGFDVQHSVSATLDALDYIKSLR